jgi:mono/diheme cytochrome c family protein
MTRGRMDHAMHRSRCFVLILVIGALGLAACGGDGDGDPVARGDELFHGEAACATCHGPALQGTTMGPPLLHEIYRPDHHPDDAIRAAVRNGVQPHHWDFGPMPALTHLDGGDIDAVIAYVRAEQEAAGILD